MSERKLNINAPLMSVRRGGASTTPPSLSEARKRILEKRHTLPHHTNNTDMDQVTEPVAVPFNWEHIPGRRKGNNNSGIGSNPQPRKEASIAPRLPPGKSVTATKQKLEKECKVANNSVRPSNKSNSFSYGSVVTTRTDCEIERRISNVENEKKENGKEEEEDVYSDALETLSPTESFSVNCSVSGVSGLDSTNMDSNKFGSNWSDQQSREFMMSRFLPAAKAMTLQPSQYSSKKQPSVLVEQQPRDVTKLVREEKKPWLNTQITDIVPYAAAQLQEEEESEDEGNVYDNSAADISAKGCGLIPRLHIRNSLCLLNPVPGMKNQVSLPSATEALKPNKKSHLRSFSPVPAVKKAWEAIHKNKSNSRSSSPDLQEGRKRWTSDSNRFSYFSGELLSGRLSPFRRSRAATAGVSPCRSKPSSPFRGSRIPSDSIEAETNYSGKLRFHSGGLVNVQEILSQGGKRSSYSGNLTIEKTLYIDTASTFKLPSSNLSSVDNNQRIDNFVAELNRRRGKDSSNSTKESSQDTKHVHALEEKDTLDANSATFYSMLHLKAKEDKDEALTTSQDINREAASFTEDSEINNQQIVLAESALSPLPPPLPKSPSESWLCRALPLVSVKNSFLHSNQGTQSHAKWQDSNTTTSSNIKWETIVKTSNLHHDHVRYSQELTTHKSQHSKS